MKINVTLASLLLFLQAGLLWAEVPTRLVASTDAAAIRLQTESIFEKLVEIRRDLHRQPELAGNESRTAATVATHLRKLGLEVRTGLYGYSVLGILKGAHPGKTLAWRAELDALPGDFADPASFKSKTPGVHHACGHDIHIAIALGIAEILAKHRAQLHGTVVFIFQPEEETFNGAKAMIEKGVFSSIKPAEIYGLHVTALPVGQIVVRANEMFAYQRRVSIRLKNELSKLEIEQLTKNIQSALTRVEPGAKPWEIQNIVDPVIGLTAKSTGFKNYLIMDPSFNTRTENGELILAAYLYETEASRLASNIARIRLAIVKSGHERQLISVSYVEQNPTVLNDRKLTRFAINALKQSDGSDVKASYGQAPFFNDDFAYFQQKIPGVYFFLGGSNAEKGMFAMNHAPNFQVDEESIRVGVQSFSSLIIARLGTP